MFKDRYFGNLMLRHKEVGYFQGTDKQFFEGLAQQLASTIYRLETVQAREEFEQRALAAEEMSSIGEIAFGLTHRLDNDLGLVESYVNDVRRELGITNGIVSGKLENIKRAVRKVLDMSEALKGALTKSGDALTGEPVTIAPKILLEDAKLEAIPSSPSAIQIDLEIDDDVACILAIFRLVMDILDELISNAIQAMPDGGTIVLKARNIGRSVALDVTDTGIGIPQSNQAKIFGLFYTTKRSFGFGLWNARRNALKNGGDLKVLESQPGQGTTFRLLLPRVDEVSTSKL
jgi:signal transduction histidine kinase